MSWPILVASTTMRERLSSFWVVHSSVLSTPVTIAASPTCNDMRALDASVLNAFTVIHVVGMLRHSPVPPSRYRRVLPIRNEHPSTPPLRPNGTGIDPTNPVMVTVPCCMAMSDSFPSLY